MPKTQITLSPMVARQLEIIANDKKCSLDTLAAEAIESYCQQIHLPSENSQKPYCHFQNILYFKTTAANLWQIFFWATIPSLLLLISLITSNEYVQSAVLDIFSVQIILIYSLMAYFIDLLSKIIPAKTSKIGDNYYSKTLSPIIELYNSTIFILSSSLGFLTFYSIYSYYNGEHNSKTVEHIGILLAFAILLCLLIKLSKDAESNKNPIGFSSVYKFIDFFNQKEWYKKKCEMSFIIIGGSLAIWSTMKLF